MEIDLISMVGLRPLISWDGSFLKRPVEIDLISMVGLRLGANADLGTIMPKWK